MPSLQERKVKPLEGVVYLPKSENIVAVKLASSLYKLSLQTRERWHYRASLQEGKKKGLWELSRYFSLLSIAEKIFARILLNRLNEHIVPHIVPETRCGIRSGRGTVDMIDPLFATVIREV